MPVNAPWRTLAVVALAAAAGVAAAVNPPSHPLSSSTAGPSLSTNPRPNTEPHWPDIYRSSP